MKKRITKHWGKDQVKPALAITASELIALGITQDEIDKGKASGHLKTFGPWGIPVSYKALVMSAVWTPEDRRQYTAERDSETAYGIGTLSACQQSGYQLEGRVSVNGRKVRGFTSDQLFELENGRLVSVATIHACL